LVDEELPFFLGFWRPMGVVVGLRVFVWLIGPRPESLTKSCEDGLAKEWVRVVG
jgi:hypothetical protein